MTLHALLSQLISDPLSHAKWLNTLSYLENCGARKIARSEHPREVSKEMLKHAAEEFRHAFYLKTQITTKLGQILPTYHPQLMWGGWDTLRYLDHLELAICRLLKKHRLPLKKYAYPLVTYAIEVRAAELYPVYQDLLLATKSLVSVRSILLDEKGHLEEMTHEMKALALDRSIITAARAIEEKIYVSWSIKIMNTVCVN